MQKYKYVGKTKEEALSKAIEELNLQENEYYVEEQEVKQGLFKGKSIEIEIIKKEIGINFKFLLDVGEYKIKQQKNIERLAKQIAREVAKTKVEAKMDSMNSYERRLVHNILNDNTKVYTESEGEEPNRYVVIKPKEEDK